MLKKLLQIKLKIEIIAIDLAWDGLAGQKIIEVTIGNYIGHSRGVKRSMLTGVE